MGTLSVIVDPLTIDMIEMTVSRYYPSLTRKEIVDTVSYYLENPERHPESEIAQDIWYAFRRCNWEIT